MGLGLLGFSNSELTLNPSPLDPARVTLLGFLGLGCRVRRPWAALSPKNLNPKP